MDCESSFRSTSMERQEKETKEEKITSHNVIGTGDLGFNIFMKPPS